MLTNIFFITVGILFVVGAIKIIFFAKKSKTSINSGSGSSSNTNAE